MEIETQEQKTNDLDKIPRDIWYLIFQYFALPELHKFAKINKKGHQLVHSFWNAQRPHNLSKELFDYFINLKVSGHWLLHLAHQDEGVDFLMSLHEDLKSNKVALPEHITDVIRREYLQSRLIEPAWQGQLTRLIILQQLTANLSRPHNDETDKVTLTLTFENGKMSQPDQVKERFLKRNPTVLHIVARNGHLTCVQFLLSLPNVQQNINALDAVNMTALHYAVDKKHLDTVKLLHQNGANLNIVSTAKNQDQQGTPLHITVHHGSLEILQFLLENGADPNLKGAKGQTPLHIACIHQLAPDFAVLLVQYGADRNARDDNNKTPIAYIKDSSFRQAVLNATPIEKKKGAALN